MHHNIDDNADRRDDQDDELDTHPLDADNPNDDEFDFPFGDVDIDGNDIGAPDAHIPASTEWSDLVNGGAHIVLHTLKNRIGALRASHPTRRWTTPATGAVIPF